MDELPQLVAFREAMLKDHNVVIGDISFDVVCTCKTKMDKKLHKEGNYPEKHGIFLHFLALFGGRVEHGWWLKDKVVSNVNFKHPASR